MQYTKLPTDVLAEFIIAQALEHTDSIEDRTDVGWSLNDIEDIEAVDEITVEEEDETRYAVRVYAVAMSSVREKVASATQINPPEYESHDVQVMVNLTWVPKRHGGLGGIDVTAEQLNHPLARPDPEPQWRDI